MSDPRLAVGDVTWQDLYGLYSEGWGDRMVPEAMAHPAKVRPAVARAIFDYALKQGWWTTRIVLTVTQELVEYLIWTKHASTAEHSSNPGQQDAAAARMRAGSTPTRSGNASIAERTSPLSLDAPKCTVPTIASRLGEEGLPQADELSPAPVPSVPSQSLTLPPSVPSVGTGPSVRHDQNDCACRSSVPSAGDYSDRYHPPARSIAQPSAVIRKLGTPSQNERAPSAVGHSGDGHTGGTAPSSATAPPSGETSERRDTSRPTPGNVAIHESQEPPTGSGVADGPTTSTTARAGKNFLSRCAGNKAGALPAGGNSNCKHTTSFPTDSSCEALEASWLRFALSVTDDLRLILIRSYAGSSGRTPPPFLQSASHIELLISELLPGATAVIPSSTVVDPFGGVGGFLLTGGWAGLQLVGVELEERFVGLCKANIELHAATWDAAHPRPVILHGDSRRLAHIVGAAGGAVTSPPFGSADSAGPESLHRRTDATAAKMLACQGWHGGGQESPGNLALLPMGGLATSPPYEEGGGHKGNVNRDIVRGKGIYIPADDYTGIVSSPPYAESLQDPGGSRTPNAPPGFKLGRSTAGVVSSPPFQGAHGGAVDGNSMIPPAEAKRGKGTVTAAVDADGYGSSPGQLGGMPAGSLDGLSTSPPYSNALTRGDSLPDTPNSARMREMGGRMAYGASEGQLGEMEAGDLDGIASSPPFEKQQEGGGQAIAGAYRTDGHKPGDRGGYQNQGDSAGQLGNDKGPTFWAAARDIVLQCHAVLKPGAVTAWVCKDFVRAKQRVPFCDDWCRLLAMCGFQVFERWRMWQRSRHDQHNIFGGKAPQRENKGFFRKLAESKGSPRIDWEEAIWARKAPSKPAPAEMPLFKDASKETP